MTSRSIVDGAFRFGVRVSRRRGLAGDPREGGVEGARGEQGAGGLGEQAAGEAAAGADGDGGVDLACRRSAGARGRSRRRSRPGRRRDEAQAALVGLVDLDVEADAAPGEAAGDARAAAAPQARRVELVDVERDRRPAREGVGVGQDVEHGRGLGRRRWRWRSMSSWPRMVSAGAPRVVGPADDLALPRRRTGSSSGMTCDRPAADDETARIGGYAFASMEVAARQFAPAIARLGPDRGRRPAGGRGPRRADRRAAGRPGAPACAARSRSSSARRSALALRRRRRCSALVPRLRPASSPSLLAAPVNDILVAPFFGVIFASYSLGAEPTTIAAGRWCSRSARPSTRDRDRVDTSATRRQRPRLGRARDARRAGPRRPRRCAAARELNGDAARARRRRSSAEREQAAATAVADERTRIAGELHDVVAHALSAMVVQAAGARRCAVAQPGARPRGVRRRRGDRPRGARRDAPAARRAAPRGRGARARAPAEPARTCRSLVERARRAGLPVELSVDGAARELPAGVDLTAYRVVQEALAGARRAGGAGRRAGARALRARRGRARGARRRRRRPARDLGGVRERVSLYGGELRAGAQRGGGHAVAPGCRVGVPACTSTAPASRASTSSSAARRSPSRSRPRRSSLAALARGPGRAALAASPASLPVAWRAPRTRSPPLRLAAGAASSSRTLAVASIEPLGIVLVAVADRRSTAAGAYTDGRARARRAGRSRPPGWRGAVDVRPRRPARRGAVLFRAQHGHAGSPAAPCAPARG